MHLKEVIYKRKSCRSFTGLPVGSDILETIKTLEQKPLYPDIKTHYKILPREQVKCLCPWTTPQVIAIYSEKKDGYLENVGFLFQQLDLQLQDLGLGVCWLGMGRLDSQSAPRIDGMEFIIMLAFGYPKGNALRMTTAEFKRKPLASISDTEDPRLEPARLAPSSVNSQPWYFTHESDTIHVYCVQKGILKASLSQMNQIDMGIALAHLYVSNPETFRFFRTDCTNAVKGCAYMGSITL